LFFVDRKRLKDYPRLDEAFHRGGEASYLSRVHPAHHMVINKALYKKIFELQCLAMWMTLKLREINLLAFPDWNRPEQIVVSQLRGLISAVAAHPEHRRMALIIALGQSDARTRPLVLRASGEALMPEGGPLVSGPQVGAVGGSFGPDEWRVLVACSQGRVVIHGEDGAAIDSAQAGHLPTISLETLQLKQPLGVKALAMQ